MAKNPRLIDLSGQRCGKWLVRAQAGNTPRGGALWHCICDCGTERAVLGNDLRSGKSASCGCTIDKQRLGNSNRTHGGSGTPLYNVWRNMRGRCRDQKNERYPHYGGRGITICQDWDDYAVFYQWAKASGYRRGLSIERINVNGDYCPENCTWAGPDVQAANRRFVKRAPDGELWWHKAKANGISRAAYAQRVHAGWPMEDAVTWPQGKRRVQRSRDDKGRFA